MEHYFVKMITINKYISEKLHLNKDTENLIVDDELKKWAKSIEDFVKDNITLEEKYYDINCVKEDWPNGPLNKIQFSTGIIATHIKELEELPEKIKKFLDDNHIKNEINSNTIDNPIRIFLINIQLYNEKNK